MLFQAKINVSLKMRRAAPRGECPPSMTDISGPSRIQVREPRSRRSEVCQPTGDTRLARRIFLVAAFHRRIA
jgi:hypothetical protein